MIITRSGGLMCQEQKGEIEVMFSWIFNLSDDIDVPDEVPLG